MDICLKNVCDNALAYLQKGELEKAGLLYSKILATNPDHQISLTNLTFIIYSIAPKKALRIMLNLQQKTVEHSCLQFKLAELFQQLGYERKAIQIFINITQAQSENVEVYFRLGNIYKEKGEHITAESYFKKAFELEPDNKKTLNNYVDILHILGQSTEIDKIFERLIQLSINDTETYIALGDLYKRIGELKKAEGYFRKALLSCPGNEMILHQLGSILLFQNNFLEAALVFKQAIEINPQFCPASSSYKYALRALMNEDANKKPTPHL